MSASVNHDGQVADVDRLRDLAGDLARLGDVRRHQGQPELGHQPEVGGVRVADHLAAELDPATVGELGLLDPAADPVARLEDGDRGAAGLEVARGARARRARHRRRRRLDGSSLRHFSTTACSGSQPICTRSPGVPPVVRTHPRQVLLEHGQGDAGAHGDEVLRRRAVVARRDDRAGRLHHLGREVAHPDLLGADGDADLSPSAEPVCPGTGIVSSGQTVTAPPA